MRPTSNYTIALNCMRHHKDKYKSQMFNTKQTINQDSTVMCKQHVHNCCVAMWNCFLCFVYWDKFNILSYVDIFRHYFNASQTIKIACQKNEYIKVLKYFNTISICSIDRDMGLFQHFETYWHIEISGNDSMLFQEQLYWNTISIYWKDWNNIKN